jgi:hypothetical protein
MIFKHNGFRAAGLLIALSGLSACSLDLKPNVTVDPKVTVSGSNLVSCSAVVASSVPSVIASGQAIPVTVKATGGVAPYQIVNSAISFDSETTVSRSFTNTTSANVQRVGTVVVKDTVGLIAQCNFTVTVAPAGTNPSTLACTLAGTPSTPSVNQSVAFLASASGGTAPYTFSNFVAGADSTVVNSLTSASATTATATARYSTSGLKAPEVRLTDSTGTFVTCSQSLNVAAIAAVSVVAAPATAVIAGNTITLTATPSAFTSTPTYTFTTTRAGVSIQTVGNIAYITSPSVQSLFDVVVSATNGTQSASSTISLAFTTPSSLVCSISHRNGMLYVNDLVNFDVTASTGEALEITYFATHSDGVITSQSSASRTVRYSVAGIKTVLIQARAIASGALCQAGAVMSDTVEISPTPVQPLSCSGFTSLNPSYAYEYFTANATITGGQGSKWVESLTLTKNGTTVSNFDGSWIDALSARIRIFSSGSYLIRYNIKDAYGNTGSCTTTQVVW